MSEAQLRLVSLPAPADGDAARKPLGRYLVDSGRLTTDQLVRALDMQRIVPARLGDILRAEGWTRDADLALALSEQQGLARLDLAEHPPDPSLIGLRTPQFWMKHRALPWARLEDTLVIATADPEDAANVQAAFGTAFSVLPVVADAGQVMAHLSRLLRPRLAAASLTRVAPDYSCRSWRGARTWQRVPLALALTAAGILLAAPYQTIAALSLIAMASLMLIASLKTAGLISHLMTPPRRRHRLSDGTDVSGPLFPVPSEPRFWPRFSVIVPLYREEAVAERLVARLRELSYPKALLQVLLVLEEHDTVTRAAIQRSDLPPWMRVITVPAYGGLTTKPRAMNFALDFCDGDIIGVWDAEDAPAPDQLERIARRFARAPRNVACLQGVLDFYNPACNWLARCFTIEYASWFRVILPGIARLGLVVPLGGTTMFIRRAALERVGAWDAHNVTEDADLGVRLARFGYVTEIMATVTREEANCRAWPWIKQRSRWLKGFMVTYLVHMRHPRRLWRDLGPLGFLSVQAFFVGTVSQFLLAPVLWSFWLLMLGLPHPAQAVLPADSTALLLTLLICAGAVNVGTGFVAVSGRAHRHLMPWVPSLILYFPLGAMAAFKALWELATDPYFWDKTQHGLDNGPPRT
ncbi:MAG: glycosyl transferase [Rhodobacteraceae bacterium]|nr:glycosyl transferase [Paracoccaceae bacterium]MAY46279.1 glycosyl transferase [Paracoccaceae bacterium]